MAGLVCCLAVVIEPGWNCSVNSFIKSRTSTFSHADMLGNHGKKQIQFCLDRLWNRSDYWNKGRRKGPSEHLRFNYRISWEPFCLDNQCKTLWVNCFHATLHVQLPCGLERQNRLSVSEFRRGDGEVRRLCEEGQLNKALDILDQLQSVPSVNTYRGLLKLCTRQRALSQAKRVHAHLARHGLEARGYLGESLVNAFVKCGSLEDALHVFEKSQHRTVISWTAVISGFSKAGQGHKALSIYHSMREDGVHPDNYTFVSLLQACGSIADLEQGKQIHSEAVEYGFESDLYVGTGLVDMYVKCGSIADAQSAFDRLSHRDLVTWNALLAGYAQQNHVEKVLQVYEEMQKEVGADDRTFVSVLQACGNPGDNGHFNTSNGHVPNPEVFQRGRTLHAESWRMGYGSHIFVGNALISMYSKAASVLDAWNVFDGLIQRDVVSWTAIIASYVQLGHSEKALGLYLQMQEAGFSPNDRTIVSMLQACGNLAEMEENVSVKGKLVGSRSFHRGKCLHAAAVTKGQRSNVFVANSLISMYGKCGSWVDAQCVFDGLPQRTLVSWNAMFMTYVLQSQVEKAFLLYRQMWEAGLNPDDWTFVIALQACTLVAAAEEGVDVDGQCIKVETWQKVKAIHAELLKKGYESNNFVGSSLVSVYGRCGNMVEARSVFDTLTWTVVACNAMITVYVQHDQRQMALQLFRDMQEAGVIPNETTVVCILQACSNTGTVDNCVQIHEDLVLTGNVGSPLVASALIHACGSCARMKDAQQLFDTLPQPDVVSWTALMAGYAKQGCYERTMQCFETMQRQGIKPDAVSFLPLLAACSHAGQVETGIETFESMSRDHGIAPRIEHYGIALDLLARAGYFVMVEDLLSSMPMEPDLSMWLCLLGACQKHGNLVLGKRAFDHAVILQPKHPAAYILMSNIYADAGLWESAMIVDDVRQQGGALKNPGQSWIEHELEVITFVAGDWQHRQQKPIFELMKTVHSCIEAER